MRYLTDDEIATWYAGLVQRPVAAVLVNEEAGIGHAYALMEDESLWHDQCGVETLEELEQVAAMLRAKLPKAAGSEAR